MTKSVHSNSTKTPKAIRVAKSRTIMFQTQDGDGRRAWRITEMHTSEGALAELVGYFATAEHRPFIRGVSSNSITLAFNGTYRTTEVLGSHWDMVPLLCLAKLLENPAEHARKFIRDYKYGYRNGE